MHTTTIELVRAHQRELTRTLRLRRWDGDLRAGRRRDGSLWLFGLPRRR
ncbi:MAG: hypothetical protein KF809_04910 [Chloroflexi bacterium]|nr:hypothetical protein [Chloroflexota bacterium]